MDNFKKVVTIWVSIIATTLLIAYNIPSDIGIICGVIAAYSGLALLWYILFYIFFSKISPVIEKQFDNKSSGEKQNLLLTIIAIFTVLIFFKNR